jgi:hypothetical protein
MGNIARQCSFCGGTGHSVRAHGAPCEYCAGSCVEVVASRVIASTSTALESALARATAAEAVLSAAVKALQQNTDNPDETDLLQLIELAELDCAAEHDRAREAEAERDALRAALAEVLPIAKRDPRLCDFDALDRAQKLAKPRARALLAGKVKQ